MTGFFEATNATNRRNECYIDFDIDEDEDGKVYLDAVVEQWLPVRKRTEREFAINTLARMV